MTDETLAHIFEPFYTTKELGKGTGLGLATCHGIVRQIGGAISPVSAPGRGTTFRILLPAAHGTTAAPVPDVADARREGTETILVVEDDDAIRHLAAVGLRRRGYQVLEAASGSQALEIADAYPYDLAVSDVVMPGMSGAELGRHLRTIRPGARLILASGHPRAAVWASMGADDEDDDGLGWGPPGAPRPDEPDAFLAKPYTLERLVALVRRVLDGRRDEA
jgi:CheY-like chemotaxis protein